MPIGSIQTIATVGDGGICPFSNDGGNKEKKEREEGKKGRVKYDLKKTLRHTPGIKMALSI